MRLHQPNARPSRRRHPRRLRRPHHETTPDAHGQPARPGRRRTTIQLPTPPTSMPPTKPRPHNRSHRSRVPKSLQTRNRRRSRRPPTRKPSRDKTPLHQPGNRHSHNELRTRSLLRTRNRSLLRSTRTRQQLWRRTRRPTLGRFYRIQGLSKQMEQTLSTSTSPRHQKHRPRRHHMRMLHQQVEKHPTLIFGIMVAFSNKMLLILLS